MRWEVGVQTIVRAACAWVLMSACASPSPPDPPPSTPAEPAPPRALLITLGGVRRDALGAYGHAPSVTPQLDAFAATAAVFDEAWTTAPLTVPAHASLLTGLYPARHGLRDDTHHLLDPSAHTLAEQLRAASFTTSAVLGTDLLHPTVGLDQGFTTYLAPTLDQRGTPLEPATWPAVELTERAHALLTTSSPSFTWVHLPLPPHDGEPGYLAALSTLDQAVGDLLSALAPPDAHTVVVITADHGLDPGTEPTPGYFVRPRTARVPLLLRAPHTTPGRVSATASLVDLAPTLLSLLGAPPLPGEPDGVDLSAALTGDLPSPRALRIESHLGAASHGWSPLDAVLDERWLLVLGPAPALYDLRTDPLATRDLYRPHQAPAPRLRASLQALGAGQPLPRLPRADLAHRATWLAALGEPTERARAPAPDLAEQRALLERLAALRALERSEQTDALLAGLADLADLHPDDPLVQRWWGAALLQHRPDALDLAERTLRHAARLDPTQPTTLLQLAAVEIRRATAAQPSSAELAKQHFDLAEGWLRACLHVEPNQPEALAHLARLVLARANAALAGGHLEAGRNGLNESAALFERYLAVCAVHAPERTTIAASAARLRQQLAALSR